MKAITLQFVQTAGLSSRLIEWYAHGWCCHVDTVLEDGRLLGARLDGGVAIRPPDYEPFTRVERVALPTTDAIAEAYHDFLWAQLGKPYDVLDIVGFAGGFHERDWRDPAKWFCSELCGRGLEVSGYLPHPLATPANCLTPPDLLLVCSAIVDIAA